VGDISIPAGTVVAALMRRGSTDERHFVRAHAFEPERWIGADTGGAKATGRERFSMPFGAGPRICPGRNLALLEINMVASMLFRNFVIADLRTEDGEQVDEWLSFTMAPSKLMITLAHKPR
jgi:cytochrome P450